MTASIVTVDIYHGDALAGTEKYEFRRYLPSYGDDDQVREEWSVTKWSKYGYATDSSRTTAFPETETMEQHIRKAFDLNRLQVLVNSAITRVEITTD